jgi:hypothetical protein
MLRISDFLVVERKKKGSRAATVRWSMRQDFDPAANPTVYVVQHRYHVGKTFNRLLLPKVGKLFKSCTT